MSSQITNLLNLRHFRPAQQIAFNISGRLVSPVSIRYTLGHGFNIESFNPLGNVQPWSIFALADFSSKMFFQPIVNNETFLDFDKLTLFTIFIGATSACISEEMYDPSVDKSEVDVQHTLKHIGTTSVTMRYDIFFPKFEESVTTGFFKLILISPETKRPSPLPQWWREKYLHRLEQNVSTLTVSSASRESDKKVSCVPLKVLPSVIDSNLHSGWYFQFKMFLEAYFLWHHQNFGFDGKGSPFRNVKYMNLLFKNEAVLGDVVKIDLHLVPENENAVQFFMDSSLNEKNSISECLLEFYPDISKNQYESKL